MTRTHVPSIVPTPSIDADPDPGNAAGGADAIQEETSIPPLTPDVPLSAQIGKDVVPEAIQEPEEPDSEANTDDPSAESPA